MLNNYNKCMHNLCISLHLLTNTHNNVHPIDVVHFSPPLKIINPFANNGEHPYDFVHFRPLFHARDIAHFCTLCPAKLVALRTNEIMRFALFSSFELFRTPDNKFCATISPFPANVYMSFACKYAISFPYCISYESSLHVFLTNNIVSYVIHSS